MFVATVALNRFAIFCVLPLVTFLGEFRFAYETYHTRILFLERYVRTPTCSVLAYAYLRVMVQAIAFNYDSTTL